MRHAIVTAGTKGLGKQVTEQLLHEGYSVTVNYRSDEQAVEAMKEAFSEAKHRLSFLKGDVTNRHDMEALVDSAVERFGRVDLLICNAGPYVFERKKLADYTDEQWYEMVDGNLNSAFHLFRKAIPIMRKQQFGRIITYGFQASDHTPGWLYRSAFAASKTALTSLTKTVAIEEAEFGITANMVCPGKILGDMKESSIADSRRQPDEETPVGRSGTGEDIARTVLFLAGEESDMITGAVVEVTGGMDVLHSHRA
ncbi:SDR family oxidoreductase [Salisediminibacterium beveridgei]|uniref:Putative oxidoreductase ytkK n=1 Tax=Salisediminibacterium beveridgei TaxID=632773 RepID=A0A1D7QTA2_9BACI|nr:SDR family oxidoreductase [Salisediminibacterium beveridgei]AOM82244.1 Putative oxidoreductase ytkK [Salisediminibacterium beveridgei]